MYKKLTSLFLIIALSITVFSLSTAPAYALNFFPTSDNTGQLNNTADTEIALGGVAATQVALDLVNLALSLLVTLCLILLLYGGFLWIWARGNAEQVQKAKDIIQGTAIGIVIVLSALGITQFVFIQVADITGATVDTAEEQASTP
ncbi:MAG: hypothetical protein Q8P90_05300 [bacterium]|nr:hypothetical protein [bacterium]